VNTITRFLTFAALAFFLSAPALRAGGKSDASLLHARQAQALLGADVWSQVIRIENEHKSRQYPRVVHALVFEFADILWFYTDSEGTQSFSMHRGLLAEEKADFAPLLAAIEPGFKHWTTVDDRSPLPVSSAALLNGCFIESVVTLRDRLLRGDEAVRPQLLSYYIDTRSGLKGHTVLSYETDGRTEVIDSAQEGKRFTFDSALRRDALKLARALRGPEVSSARLFSVDWPMARAAYLAGGTLPVSAPVATMAMASSGE
jgi:hypothetical protein